MRREEIPVILVLLEAFVALTSIVCGLGLAIRSDSISARVAARDTFQ